MKNVLFGLSLLSVLLFNFPLLSVTKGSESAVSVEPAFIFPAGEENVMLGFAWFKNGFGLQDATTSCTFNCVNPVSGSINLAGGSLYLAQDFCLKNVSSLTGIGSVIGNRRIFDVCSSITWIGDNATFENTIINLNGDLVVAGALTFIGDCLVFGRDYVVQFDGGSLAVASNSSLSLIKMQLEGVKDSNVSCTDDTGQIKLKHMRWCQAEDAIFAHGSIEFSEMVDFSGTATFSYQSLCTSTISDNAAWYLRNGILLKVGRKDLGCCGEPFACIDDSSQIVFSNCGLCVTGSGVCFAKGSVVFDKLVEVDIQSTGTDNGLIVGTGKAADDVRLVFNAGSAVHLKSGHFVYNNVESENLVATGQTAEIVRYPGSHIYEAKSVAFPPMVIASNVYKVDPIDIASGNVVSYDDTQLNLQCTIFRFTGIQTDGSIYRLPGHGILVLENGYFPMPIYVSGAFNHIAGTGDIFGGIMLQDSQSQMIWDVNGLLGTSIALNDGSIELGCDMFCGNDVMFTGSGSVDLTAHTLLLGSSDLSWTSTIAWTGNFGSVGLLSKVSLSALWTFSGVCILDGRNNTLDLANFGALHILPNSKLILKDMRIVGITDHSISCADDTASIVLDNVTWIQDGDYTFNYGSILFKNNVNFLGTYSFYYESSQTSTIDAKTEWYCAQNMWLSMGRKTADTTIEPLAFIDDTSILSFDTSTLSVAPNGMKILKGRLVCRRDAVIDINSTSTVNGFGLGDGNPADDVIVEFYPGAAMTFPRGHVIYDVTVPTNMVSQSPTARMIRKNDSVFYLKQNLLLSQLGVQIEPLSQLIVDEGKNLSYDDGLVILDDCQFYLTGVRYSSLATLLPGNGSIYMNYGQLPIGTVVAGINNIIAGNGLIMGPIIMQPGSELTWALNGVLGGYVTLNGGQLNLSAELICVDDVTFLGSGAVDLSYYRIQLGTGNTTWRGPIEWQGIGGVIDLRSNITLTGVWMISGNVTIQGNGNTLDLANTGTLLVMPGGSLSLKNITLKGISGQNVACYDDTGVVILDDVSWMQDGLFTFTHGALQYKNKVGMYGDGYVFAYQSAVASTICSRGSLILDNNFTFSYDPRVIANKELFTFENETACLVLNSASFHVTGTGVKLTKGMICIQRNARISSEVLDLGNGTLLDEGITFGDGIDPINDLKIVLQGSSTLSLESGTLNYRNINHASFALDLSSCVVMIQDDCTLNLYQTLDVSPGSILLGRIALGRADGVDLMGCMNVYGLVTFVDLQA